MLSWLAHRSFAGWVAAVAFTFAVVLGSIALILRGGAHEVLASWPVAGQVLVGALLVVLVFGANMRILDEQTGGVWFGAQPLSTALPAVLVSSGAEIAVDVIIMGQGFSAVFAPMVSLPLYLLGVIAALSYLPDPKGAVPLPRWAYLVFTLFTAMLTVQYAWQDHPAATLATGATATLLVTWPLILRHRLRRLLEQERAGAKESWAHQALLGGKRRGRRGKH